MAESIERVLGWLAAIALVLALGALAVTYVPGGQAVRDKILAVIPHATDTPSIDDAQSALDSGDAATANRIATQVVAANSSDADVDNHAGNIAQRAGDDATAIHDYQLGEAANSHDGWNFVALGQLYASQGKYSLADPQLRAALSLVSNAQFLHYDLGVVELNEHLPQAALADFDAELKRSPRYDPAASGRIQALEALGRWADARAATVALGKTAAPAVSAPPVEPSPTPTSAVPSPAPSPAPQASPTSSTPTPTPAPAVTPSPTPLPIAQIVAASPTPATAPTPKRTSKPAMIATPHAMLLPPAATVAPSTVPLPQSIAFLASDAKGYLFAVASDPGFGGALPFADPTQPVGRMQATIKSGTVDDVLSAGTAAMLSHHFALAASAFSTASSRAPADWRGPYLAGINAQQRGDQSGAHAFFEQAASRGGQPAVYVGLAVSDVALGDDTSAYDEAQHAISMSPSFEPALFTAGMIDILIANAPAAERDLGAAEAAGGAPDRTAYFLSTLRAREEGSQ